jgi:hypothetical protein
MAEVRTDYAWSDAATARYDSPWLRTALFAALNRVGRSRMAALQSMRTPHPIAGEHFAAQRQYTATYFQSLAALTERNWLRYCPVCIAQGYHSFWHQVGIVDRCPLHGTVLVRACPHCKTALMVPLRPFRGRVDSCHSCGKGLLPDAPRAWHKSATFRREEIAAFADLAVWAQTLAASSWGYPTVARLTHSCVRPEPAELGTMLARVPGLRPTATVRRWLRPAHLDLEVTSAVGFKQFLGLARQWPSVEHALLREIEGAATTCLQRGECRWTDRQWHSSRCGGIPWQPSHCP